MANDPNLTAIQAALRFQEVLHRILEVGRWTPQPFADALRKAGSTARDEIVGAWFAVTPNGRPIPSPKNFACILKILCGACPETGELKAAWDQVRRLDRPKRAAQISIAAGSVVPVWVAEPVAQVEGLVDLIVNQPVPDNFGTAMRLPGTLIIDGGFTRSHQGRMVHIGVTELDLALDAPSNKPQPNSRFRYARDNLGAKEAAGGVRVAQPCSAGGWIDGDLLEDGTIAFLEASGNGERPITVRVLARPDRFVVHDVTGGVAPRAKTLGDARDAVVGAIIRLGREVDEQDRVAIGRARLFRRKEA